MIIRKTISISSGEYWMDITDEDTDDIHGYFLSSGNEYRKTRITVTPEGARDLIALLEEYLRIKEEEE